MRFNLFSKFSKKEIISFCLIIISAFIIFFISKGNGIESIKSETCDGYIQIEWKSYRITNSDIMVDVYSDDTIVKKVELRNNDRMYKYSEGVHGHMYRFDVYYQDQKQENISSSSSLFLDFDKIPNLTLISIETDNGILPSYKETHHPEGSWGNSITDNEYVNGTINITNSDSEDISERIKIKIRGNTSAYKEQTQYKLLFEEPVCLLDSYEDKEYLLLGKANDLKWVLGLYISRYLGIEWQTDYKFVNLIINGDYRGCYLLTENVKKADGRIQIADSGYIIENDAYWWNSNNRFFKTHYQFPAFGWTLKYPEQYTNSEINKIKNFITEFENYLYSDDERYKDYIDIDSFASWLIINDLLCVWDSGGTNMYLAKYDYDDRNPTSSKLKMITNWDFDSMFDDRYAEDWSAVHNSAVLYYDQLLKQKDFCRQYVSIYGNKKDSIIDDAVNYLNKFSEQYGEAIEESWKLTEARFSYELEPIDSLINQYKDCLSKKVSWMNEHVNIYES